MHQSLDSLRGRNRNLNAAYLPPWEVPANDPSMALDPGTSGDTNFDPFMGSGWGTFLDALGANEPGGAKVAGGTLPRSPLALSQQDPDRDTNPAMVGLKKATANRQTRKQFPGAR